jgi:hypothetical protein
MKALMEKASANHTSSYDAFFQVWARGRRSLFWIVAIALLLRVGWIVIGHTYKFKTTDI